MDIFSPKGSVGAGAGYAAMLLMGGLLKHLVQSGALKPEDREAIIDEALAAVPTMPNANYDDTRHALNEARN